MSYRIGLLDVAGCVLSYDYLYVSSDLSFEPSQILVQKDHCRDSISQLKYSRCLRLTAKKKESPHSIAQTLGDLYKHFRTRTWVTSVTSVTSWKCGRKKKEPGQNAKMSTNLRSFCEQTISQFFWASSKQLPEKTSSKIFPTPDHLLPAPASMSGVFTSL